MQIKNILTTLAALAIGSAIASPVPAEDSLTLRAAEPKPANLIRAEQATNIPSNDLLNSYSSAASSFAQSHAGQAPTSSQLTQARSWWPNYNYGYNNNWGYNTWYNYYYYSYYPQYNNYWSGYLNWSW